MCINKNRIWIETGVIITSVIIYQKQKQNPASAPMKGPPSWKSYILENTLKLHLDETRSQ